MSIATSVYLCCDWPSCSEWTFERFARRAETARERAAEAGWVHTSGLDFCPEHVSVAGAGGAHHPTLDTRQNRSAPSVVECSCGWSSPTDAPLAPRHARERWRYHVRGVVDTADVVAP